MEKDIKKTNNKGNNVNKKKSMCSISEKCGGCQYLDVEYEKQLKDKHKKLKKLLKDYGEVDDVIGMKTPLHYRNKVHRVLDFRKGKGVIAGTYEEKSHRVVPVKHCYIEDERCQCIIDDICELIKSFKMTIFNEDTGFGFMRHILLRTGNTSGQIMVVLVTANGAFPSKKNFVNALLKKHPEITTIVQNINDKKTSMVLGTRENILYGKGVIEDTLCGRKFKISSRSFYQINPVQTEILYKKALKFADFKKNDRIIDAYCGIGTIGIIASEKVKEVIGVELNKDAVKDAITNAKLNGVKNIKFYNNDAGKFMKDIALANEEGELDKVVIDGVIMDPPRTGSSEEFLEAVTMLSPKKVVYISCGPESLARDLKYLTSHGYEVKKMCGVDMFAMTEHVESVVLLSRKFL